MSASEAKGEGMGLNGPIVTGTGSGGAGTLVGLGALVGLGLGALAVFKYRLGPALAVETLLKGLS
jgi:hypothetical protein